MGNNVDRKQTRMPTIPLDYESKDISFKGEIIVDWENKAIYGKKRNSDQIVPLSIPKLPDNGISLTPVAPLKAPSGRYGIYDGTSIESYFGSIQLKDFNIANSDSFPVKDTDGELIWVNVLDYNKSYMKRNKISITSLSTTNLVFTAGGIYETENIITQAIVKLPINLDTSYSKILWLNKTINNNYELDTNTTMEFDTDINIIKNSTFLCEFETWDSGTTWTGRIINNKVTKDYLNINYYNKEELDASIYNKISEVNNPTGFISDINYSNYTEYTENIIEDMITYIDISFNSMTKTIGSVITKQSIDYVLSDGTTSSIYTNIYIESDEVVYNEDVFVEDVLYTIKCEIPAPVDKIFSTSTECNFISLSEDKKTLYIEYDFIPE
jgi:hypothetical protein